MSDTSSSELEVQFKPESGKAVIEGRTAVPFQSLVLLILQRKVDVLYKKWGRDSVIVSSELLTSLASAPQDSQENKSNLVLVTFVTGILGGITGFALLQLGLLLGQITLGYRELGIIVGSVGLLVVLMVIVMKGQKRPKSEKLVETMEQVSTFLSKR